MPISQNTARTMILRAFPNYVIKQSLELPKQYVFAIWPPDATEGPDDPYQAVDKNTGKISGFNPQMDIQNFKAALANQEKNDELAHYGIKGMHWYLRRFQNEDGSLTAAGRRRYLNKDGSLTGKGYEEAERLRKEYATNRSKYNALTGKRVSTRQAQPMGPKQQVQEQPKPAIKQPPRPDDPRTLTKQQLEDAISYQRALNNYNAVFNPQRQKVGARLVAKMWYEVVEPGVTNAAKGVVEAKLKQYASKRFNVNLNNGNNNKKG